MSQVSFYQDSWFRRRLKKWTHGFFVFIARFWLDLHLSWLKMLWPIIDGSVLKNKLERQRTAANENQKISHEIVTSGPRIRGCMVFLPRALQMRFHHYLVKLTLLSQFQKVRSEAREKTLQSVQTIDPLESIISRRQAVSTLLCHQLVCSHSTADWQNSPR